MKTKAPDVSHGRTEYRIHVRGKVAGEDQDVIHTYRCSQRPKTLIEAERMAEDFTRIDKIVAEEITTVVKSRIVQLG